MSEARTRTDAAGVIRRADELRSARVQHEPVWRDCYRMTYPLRGAGIASEVVHSETAQSRVADALSSVASDSVRILASAMMTGLTPPSARWFDLYVDGASDAEARWLDECSDLVWQAIHSSNYDAVAYEAMLDVLVAGWAALYVAEGDDGGLVCEVWPVGEVYLAQSRPHGMVDVVYRRVSLSAAQAVAVYGADALTDHMRRTAEDRPHERFEFVIAIEPETGGGRWPVRSVHVSLDGPRVVRESGYYTMPVIVPRWTSIPGSAYAHGPVFDALPNIRMLNELRRMHLAHAEIDIAPPMLAINDGVLNARTVKLGPRKVIVVNSVESLRPLQTGGNWQLSYQEQDYLERSIRRSLLADQLQPQDGPAMTATEVHVRVGLVRQLLGPVSGRMQPELLAPLIGRVFDLAWRSGTLPPPPRTLEGREFVPKYLSPMARSQRLDDVAAMERLYAQVAAMAEMKPGALDLLNEDEMVRESGRALGVPTKVLRAGDEVEEYRRLRAEEARERETAAAQDQLVAQAASAAVEQAAVAPA